MNRENRLAADGRDQTSVDAGADTGRDTGRRKFLNRPLDFGGEWLRLRSFAGCAGAFCSPAGSVRVRELKKLWSRLGEWSSSRRHR